MRSMDYFVIGYDRRLQAIGDCLSFPEQMLRGYDFAEAHEIVDVKPGRAIEPGCIIERPMLLVSDEIRQVFRQFEPEMASKTVVVIDREHSSQAIFFWMDVKRISCITEDAAKAKKEMRIEDIVIDTSLAAEATIF